MGCLALGRDYMIAQSEGLANILEGIWDVILIFSSFSLNTGFKFAKYKVFQYKLVFKAKRWKPKVNQRDMNRYKTNISGDGRFQWEIRRVQVGILPFRRGTSNAVTIDEHE